MKIIIGCLTSLFFLLSGIESAQSDELANSCKSSEQMALDIPDIAQENQWCWAAAAQNIMGYYNNAFVPPDTKQCSLVQVFSSEPCCDDKATVQCQNMAGHPELIFKKNKFTYAPARLDTNKILNWTEATNEICEGRPYHAFIYLDGVNPHSVVVVGYDTTGGFNEIDVFDPIEGQSLQLPFDEFILETKESENQLFTHHRDTYQVLPPK